jgi:hypothetical protein
VAHPPLNWRRILALIGNIAIWLLIGWSSGVVHAETPGQQLIRINRAVNAKSLPICRTQLMADDLVRRLQAQIAAEAKTAPKK